MYISLYRRYRPQTFSDMVGQSAAVGVLQESLREGSLGHAYLFSGPRGCGKTSAARLVAKSLDCLNRGEDCEPCGKCENCRAIAAGEHLDVIEIDGASNRGIGEIRDLKSHVSLKPLSASYKVYIIDEVHMLTDAAFNALLKTLEEPPANVVFMLATTEPHKVPVTIRSRCQHIPFHRITVADTVSRLKYVLSKEKIDSDEEAVWEIARQADGALRDALSLTEQAVALGRGRLSIESVKELTGGSSRAELERWVSTLRANPREAVCLLHSIMGRGISPERLCEALFVLFRDLWLYSLWGEKALSALETSSDERDYLAEESKHWNAAKLESACSLLGRLLPRAHYGMKGDIFSGLVFMELQNILNGGVSLAQPIKTIPQPVDLSRPTTTSRPDETAPEQQSQRSVESAPQKKESFLSAHGAVATDMPKPFTAIIEEKPTAALDSYSSELCSKLGNNIFSNLIANIPQADQLSIASALLYAELACRDGKLCVEFERQSPAKTYLTAPHNMDVLSVAASKLWGISTGIEQKPEEPARRKDSVTEQISGAPSADVEKKINEPQQSFDVATARVLKMAGAELLYVKSEHTDEEESEEGEQ